VSHVGKQGSQDPEGHIQLNPQGPGGGGPFQNLLSKYLAGRNLFLNLLFERGAGQNFLKFSSPGAGQNKTFPKSSLRAPGGAKPFLSLCSGRHARQGGICSRFPSQAPGRAKPFLDLFSGSQSGQNFGQNLAYIIALGGRQAGTCPKSFHRVLGRPEPFLNLLSSCQAGRNLF